MTAPGKGGDEGRGWGGESRGKIQGPATGPLSPLRLPTPCIRASLQGHLLFEPELCDVPLLNTGPSPLGVQPPPAPHLAPPPPRLPRLAESHLPGGSIHSERWSQRVSVAWACTSCPTPAALCPTRLFSFLS